MLFGEIAVRHAEAIGGMEECVIPSDAWNSLRESLQLSRREVEIIQLVFADEKDGNIAGSLGISRHTVDTYLRRLYAKLQVSSRPQLILLIVAEYLNRYLSNKGGCKFRASPSPRVELES
jgi:DNA-binding CsgD family transcriptional regulator